MFFKKEEINNNNLTKVCALLIHAAKIDENYTEKEEEIIKKTLVKLGLKKLNVSETIEEAKILEENSIQILKLKREGKKIMKAEDFLRGNKIKIDQKVD